MKSILTLIPVSALVMGTAAMAQGLVLSGPMNGYSEMREAMIWVQMRQPCRVQLAYWPDTLPSKRMLSEPVQATAQQHHTVHLLATQVEPGVRYGYEIIANGKSQTKGRALTFRTQELWQYRRDPPPVTIAAGSCAYTNEPPYDRPGKTYGTNYAIYESIAAAKPDLMLWLGDNVYLREADWFTHTGIMKRYTHWRSLPQLQNLLAACHHYAIWDDHDYGPNDANRSWPHRDKTLHAFKQFWANNGYGVAGQEGITGAFQWGDVDFFLLDNRWHRTDPDLATVPEQMLGRAQIDWLIEMLRYSRAPFKIIAVGGQVLNNAQVYENYSRYEAERAYLLDRIAEEKITGVVFLTGDRHHAELVRVEHKGWPMYDFTTSPLTSGTHRGDEATTNRVEGTLYTGHNFGLLHVAGPRTDRTLTLRLMDAEGKEVWRREIATAEWK
jgi:alkaline phosphatase D